MAEKVRTLEVSVELPLAETDVDAPPDPEVVSGELRFLWLVEQVRLRRIGIGKAAELAGMHRTAFVEALCAHGVPLVDDSASEPDDGERPTHRLPEGAFTPEELEVMDGVDPVDPQAALAWMAGEGPDPWPERSH
jgi:Uncharacterised protein family (UPF0175)